MESINQIGFYQLENLVLQRVGFTLLDLTKEHDIVRYFTHMNPYYLNFLKAQIQKSTANEYKSHPVVSSLAKESPIVVVCDTGADSRRIAHDLETEKYINVFYVPDGVAGLRPA